MTERSIENMSLQSPSSSMVFSNREILSTNRKSLRSRSPMYRSERKMDSQSFSAEFQKYYYKATFWDKLTNTLNIFKKKNKKEKTVFVNNNNFMNFIESLRNDNLREKYKLLPPPLKEMKTLVLDFYGTLLYSSSEEIYMYDFCLELIPGNANTTMFFKKRPGLNNFLIYVSKFFEIVIYSNYAKYYGSRILKYIDPSNRVSHAIYKDGCISVNKIHYLKSLKKLGRAYDEVIFMDANATSGVLQPNNFLQIPTFYGDEQDYFLYKMIPILKWTSTLKTIKPAYELISSFEKRSSKSYDSTYNIPPEDKNKSKSNPKPSNNKVCNDFCVEYEENVVNENAPTFVNPFTSKSYNVPQNPTESPYRKRKKRELRKKPLFYDSEDTQFYEIN